MLRVIHRRIATGQIERVLDAMPEKVRRLWHRAEEGEDMA